jgi:8-oxo-dGTP diphosphatase
MTESHPPRARKLVVAGLIVDGDRVLISQRRADQSLPLQWEFPGGKVEPGEAPAAALVRELREELGVDVVVGRIWDVLFHAYRDFDLVMLVYACTLDASSPAPHAREVAAYAWVACSALPGDFDILPADRPLIERLRHEGAPPFGPSNTGPPI